MLAPSSKFDVPTYGGILWGHQMKSRTVKSMGGRARDVASLDPPLSVIDPGVDKGSMSPPAPEQIGHCSLRARSQHANAKHFL